MTTVLTRIQNRISLRAFGLGLCMVAGIYGGLYVYLLMLQEKTISERESVLASQTVLIDRGEGSMERPELYGPPAPELAEQTIEEVKESTEELLAANPTGHTTEESVPAPVPPEIADPVVLPKAPVDGLYEDTTEGRLPIIRKPDRLTAFEAYKKPFTPIAGKPFISITFLNIGISDSGSQTLIEELPPEITLAINPYSLTPDFWVNSARADGHETWMMLPVETELYPLDDPGPQTLLINAVEKQNMNKLRWVMSRAQGVAGFVTDYGPAFLKSANDARPVLNEIYTRGLGFVDGDITPSEMPKSLSVGLNAPYARIDTWIDEPATTEHVAASLRQLEVLAQSNGRANGFVHASPMTIEMVKNWIDSLPSKNLVLAPLSAQAGK